MLKIYLYSLEGPEDTNEKNFCTKRKYLRLLITESTKMIHGFFSTLYLALFGNFNH